MRVETYEYDPKLKASEKIPKNAKITVSEIDVPEPEPSREDILQAEIDDLKARMAKLEKR